LALPELDTKFRHRGTDYVVLRYAKLPNSLRAGCAQFFQRENGEGLVLSGLKDHPDRSVAMATGASPSVSSGTEQHRKLLTHRPHPLKSLDQLAIMTMCHRGQEICSEIDSAMQSFESCRPNRPVRL
jgi:hypothetical protein